jgi:hypothetical protein
MEHLKIYACQQFKSAKMLMTKQLKLRPVRQILVVGNYIEFLLIRSGFMSIFFHAENHRNQLFVDCPKISLARPQDGRIKADWF